MPFFKILDESCNPTKGSKLSACIDLYAREEIIIPQGKTGIIDIDYKDEIKIVYNNFSAENCLLDDLGEIVEDKDMYSSDYEFIKAFRIKKGDKVAQIMLCEHKTYLFGIESEAERKGGFGSTGVN